MQLRGEAPAKINLALEITGLTGDGFHTLRSVMIGLALADSIEVRGSGDRVAEPSIGLTVVGGDDDVPSDERNLAVRAMRLLMRESGASWPARLEVLLRKRVPSQAGLGGGSADAGAMLRLLGMPLGMGLSRLQELGARLGSDVPFMVAGGAALAEGRGERLRPLQAPRSWWVVLVQPPERISTPWCYQRFDEMGVAGGGGRVDALSAALERGDLAGVASNLYNDLQQPVYDRFPHLRDVPRILREAGCAGALMSGSGSCFFGLAATREVARRAAVEAKRIGKVWITQTWREAT